MGLFPVQIVNAAPDEPKMEFDRLLEQYRDLTFEELRKEIPQRDYLDGPKFDPATAKFYKEAVEKLALSKEDIELFKKNGFVSIDHSQRYSFASAYYGVWTRDLPVLVTTSSLLHALHSQECRRGV